jgi:outer membrane protein TolC
MFRNFKLVVLFFFFLNLVLIEVGAEELLTWKDCLKEAKQNHPDLIQAEEELNQAKAGKAVSRSSILPKVSSEVSGKTSKRSTGGDKTDTYSYGLTGKQLIFDGFKSIYDISAASESVKSAQYNYETVSSRVRLNLKTAFVQLLKAQKLLAITEEIAQRRKQNLELVKLRYEAGREHRGSLLNSQASLAQAEFEVAEAKRNIDLAQRQLTKELGREELTSIKAAGEFEIKPSDEKKPSFEHLAESNPFLQELITKTERARFNLKSAQADFSPEVYLSTSAGRTGSQWPPENDEWSVGVSVSLPIFEGGIRIAKVSEAEAASNKAQAATRSGRDSVLLSLEETWIELQNAIDSVGVREKFLEAAEERAKIAQAQYSTGLISFDDWSIIEDNLVNAKKLLLTAEAGALTAEAKWIQAKGGTLDYVEK